MQSLDRASHITTLCRIHRPASKPLMNPAPLLPLLPWPAAAEPRLRYYDLSLGNGSEAQDGSRVVVSSVCWH